MDATDDKERMFQIGALSKLAGVSKRTIRYYEELGLLQPADTTEGGFRLYSERDLHRLLLIKGFKHLGFSLEQIGEILLPRPAGGKKELLEYSRGVIRKQMQAIESELNRLTELLDRNKQALELLNACEKCRREACPPNCPSKRAYL